MTHNVCSFSLLSSLFVDRWMIEGIQWRMDRNERKSIGLDIRRENKYVPLDVTLDFNLNSINPICFTCPRIASSVDIQRLFLTEIQVLIRIVAKQSFNFQDVTKKKFR